MIDTIFALSSGSPPAGIAVIRISGPDALAVHRTFTTGRATDLAARHARLVSLRDPASAGILDRCVAIHFPGPGSATGEDIVEWHVHGGRAVVQAVLRALEDYGQQHGTARPAQAGEFTRRAFENGRIDLNEAEGLADLLSAETETQRKAALRMAEGHFSRRIEGWRVRVLFLAAMVEAQLDFSDEDDVPEEGQSHDLKVEIISLRRELEHELERPSAERLRDGIAVIIAGPPNAGKSTLLNALAGRDAAIVSDIAGTTRDRIEVPVAIGGIAFLLTDTAGLRDETEDTIEAVGIERSRQAMEAADIILWLGDPKAKPRDDAIAIGARCDAPDFQASDAYDLLLSVRQGTGLDALTALLCERAASVLPGEGAYVLHQRQRSALAELVDCLTIAQDNDDWLIVAEELRRARNIIDRLTGKAGVEDMLDGLFGRFCIGK